MTGHISQEDLAFNTKLIIGGRPELAYPTKPRGGIMDGCHRILKAHILGKKVRVQQFEEWPPSTDPSPQDSAC